MPIAKDDGQAVPTPMRNTGQAFDVVATNPGRGVPDCDDTAEQAAERSRNAQRY